MNNLKSASIITDVFVKEREREEERATNHSESQSNLLNSFDLRVQSVFICNKHPFCKRKSTENPTKEVAHIRFRCEGWRVSALQNCIVINQMAKLAQNMYLRQRH